MRWHYSSILVVIVSIAACYSLMYGKVHQRHKQCHPCFLPLLPAPTPVPCPLPLQANAVWLSQAAAELEAVLGPLALAVQATMCLLGAAALAARFGDMPYMIGGPGGCAAVLQGLRI